MLSRTLSLVGGTRSPFERMASFARPSASFIHGRLPAEAGVPIAHSEGAVSVRSALTLGAPAADGGIDDAMMAQIFADADELGGAPRRIGFGTADAAAEGGAPPGFGGGAADDDDFVYDVYEVLDDDAEGEGAEAAEASAAAGGAGSPEAAGEELWWEEVGPELVSELEGGLNGGDSGHDSDSNGEHDYPEDEDDDSLDDGDDGYEGVRMRGPPGNHDWFC